jgi:hypothetical protein
MPLLKGTARNVPKGNVPLHRPCATASRSTNPYDYCRCADEPRGLTMVAEEQRDEAHKGTAELAAEILGKHIPRQWRLSPGSLDGNAPRHFDWPDVGIGHPEVLGLAAGISPEQPNSPAGELPRAWLASRDRDWCARSLNRSHFGKRGTRHRQS